MTKRARAGCWIAWMLCCVGVAVAVVFGMRLAGLNVSASATYLGIKAILLGLFVWSLAFFLLKELPEDMIKSLKDLL